MSATQAVRIEAIPAHLDVRLDPAHIALPAPTQRQIEDHWVDLQAQGRRFTRGEVFTITGMSRQGGSLEITLQTTDYAHYLWTVHNAVEAETACRVLYPVALIETSDHQIVFGEMGRHTAWPGRLQFVGGGLDNADLFGDRVDLRHAIEREVREELGLDLGRSDQVVSATPAYLKSGGLHDFVVVIFRVRLAMTAAAVGAVYRDLAATMRSNGAEPEFAAIMALPAAGRSIRDFLATDQRPRVDFLTPVLAAESGAE